MQGIALQSEPVQEAKVHAVCNSRAAAARRTKAAMPRPLGTPFRRMQLPGPRRQTVERLQVELGCCMLGDVLQRGCHSCDARPAAPGSRRRLAQQRLQYSGCMGNLAATYACSSCMQGRRRSLGPTWPRRWLATHPERSRLLHRKPLTACSGCCAAAGLRHLRAVAQPLCSLCRRKDHEQIACHRHAAHAARARIALPLT